MKIFSAKQLYEADQKTSETQKISSTELMERAGNQIFQWLNKQLKGGKMPVKIFCGIGNNGGDGLVVGRLMIENGYDVTIYIVNYSDKRSKDFLINYDLIKDVTKKWPTLLTEKDDFPTLSKDDVIIDAMFGIGINRPPKGWVKKLIIHINDSGAFVLSIDMPSGLYADKPLDDSKAVIKANHTLTFTSPKLSFFLPETAEYTSYFDVLDIGLDPEYLENENPIAQLIVRQNAQKLYRPRKKWDHKGSYGHTLIIAGSYGKMGAAVLATKAAFKIGAGMVTAFVPKCGYEILQTSISEAMAITDPGITFLEEIVYPFEPDAIAVGMGIGTHKKTVAALKELFAHSKKPMVIDADALNCISENRELLENIPKNSIFTPHPGELERLIGNWENDYDKLAKAKKFAKKYKIVLVIKGANTTTLFDNKMYINTTGNPGMATAGSGDALSGVIAGLISQGYESLIAAVFGVYLHGMAGDIAVENVGLEGLMASDIIDNLGLAYIALFEEPIASDNEKGQ